MLVLVIAGEINRIFVVFQRFDGQSFDGFLLVSLE